MDPRRLFLRRCDQIAAYMASPDEGDLIDVAGRLRQLLFDGSASLVDKVNINKVPLCFEMVTRHVPDGFEQYVVATGDFGGPPGVDSLLHLSREAFSTFPVMYSRPQWITAREIVRYAALVAGGVHHDSKPRDEFRRLDLSNKLVEIGGVPSALFNIPGLARIIVVALQPLIEDVRRQLAERPTWQDITEQQVAEYWGRTASPDTPSPE